MQIIYVLLSFSIYSAFSLFICEKASIFNWLETSVSGKLWLVVSLTLVLNSRDVNFNIRPVVSTRMFEPKWSKRFHPRHFGFRVTVNPTECSIWLGTEAPLLRLRTVKQVNWFVQAIQYLPLKIECLTLSFN